MTALTTEQTLPVSFKSEDGRGRPAPIDGLPTATIGDETVARVSAAGVVDGGNNSYSLDVEPVAEGTTRLVLEGDGALGADVVPMQGILDIEVTLDPRTSERRFVVTAGAPVDKPVFNPSQN